MLWLELVWLMVARCLSGALDGSICYLVVGALDVVCECTVGGWFCVYVFVCLWVWLWFWWFCYLVCVLLVRVFKSGRRFVLGFIWVAWLVMFVRLVGWCFVSFCICARCGLVGLFCSLFCGWFLDVICVGCNIDFAGFCRVCLLVGLVVCDSGLGFMWYVACWFGVLGWFGLY